MTRFKTGRPSLREPNDHQTQLRTHVTRGPAVEEGRMPERNQLPNFALDAHRTTISDGWILTRAEHESHRVGLYAFKQLVGGLDRRRSNATLYAL